MNRVDYEYDSFTHLRRALFWDVDQPIAMLTFYADDAGKKADHDYTVVAGYIGLVAQWERFCSDWRLLLASVGLPEFHASDFFTGYGIFSGWEKRDRSQARAKLLSALAEIISDYSLHSFTCVVHTPGWLKVNEDYMLEEMGFSPFPIGGRTVAQCARQWCRDSGHDPDRVEYIFDQGSDDWGQLKNRLKNDFDIEAIDRDRRKIRPLQAADWIAYEEFREAPQSDSRIRARRFRESYRALLRVPNDPIIYREADLRSVICGAPEMKIPARSEQGKTAVRLKYDDSRMPRLSRRYKRLTKAVQGLPASLRVSDVAILEKLQAEAEYASTMAETYENIGKGFLQAMRADNQQDQTELLTQFAEQNRLQREWQEKHADLLERYLKLLKP